MGQCRSSLPDDLASAKANWNRLSRTHFRVHWCVDTSTIRVSTIVTDFPWLLGAAAATLWISGKAGTKQATWVEHISARIGSSMTLGGTTSANRFRIHRRIPYPIESRQVVGNRNQPISPHPGLASEGSARREPFQKGCGMGNHSGYAK